MPSSLTYVPPRLRDRNGRNFVDGRDIDDRYLSTCYLKHGVPWTALESLGVGEQPADVFEAELAKMLQSNAASVLSQKSSKWHDDLASVLVKENLVSFCSCLPIIPLRDGSWVAPRESYNRGVHNNFFSNEKLKNIPEGIEIRIVDDKAAASKPRRKLFEECGVRHLDNSAIREMLVKAHTGTSPKARDLSARVLLSHAEFFFKNKDEIAKPYWLQMATDSGSTRPSNRMYQPSKGPGTASSVLPNRTNQDYGFLHSVYMNYGSTEAQRGAFLAYLREQLEVEIYPRLTATLAAKTLHSDFVVLLEDVDHNRWLTVLRLGWERYESSFRNVQHLLSANRNVRILGNMTRPIGETWLPRQKLWTHYRGCVPFIDVPDADDERWKDILKPLDVGMEDNLIFYTKCLEAATRKSSAVTDKKIRDILHLLENRAASDSFGILYMRYVFLVKSSPLRSQYLT